MLLKQFSILTEDILSWIELSTGYCCLLCMTPNVGAHWSPYTTDTYKQDVVCLIVL